jgi:lipoate-protein ligase A
MDHWFLLMSPAAPGAENMALDEMLLERAARGSAPVLRLYSFDPPAITIGRHQNPAHALDVDAARAHGIDVVRRITGGRALLHAGELTYCIAASVRAAPFGTGLGEGFRRISDVLARSLGMLGIAAEVARGGEGARNIGGAPPCLASTTRWELTVGGKKIAASAQCSIAGAFLQHGSILIRPGSECIERYIPGRRGSLAGRITNIRDELGRECSDDELRQAVARSFGELMGAAGEPFRFGREERVEIERRTREKHAEFAPFRGEAVSP